MDPHATSPQILSDNADSSSRDREVLKLAIRSLLLVHCQQNDPGTNPRPEHLPQQPRSTH